MAWFRETTAGAVVLVCATLLALPAAAAGSGQPQIDATWVRDVTATGANLVAEINPNGLKTTFRFEYITDAAFKANEEAVPPRDGFFGALKAPPGSEANAGSGTTTRTETQPVSGLSPFTAYRYRVVATNSSGQAIGPTRLLRTQESGVAFRLPDGRAWEMVSPVDKGGGAIVAPGAIFGGGDVQAAATGAGAITYSSGTSFGDPAGAPPGSQYVSHRTPSGWSTENVSTPLDSGAYGDEPDGVPYRVFSTSLSRALLFGGLPCRGGLEGCPAPNPPLPGTDAPAGYMAYYLRDSSSGGLDSLLSAADVGHSAVSPPAFEAVLVAATPDLSHAVISSCAALTADAIEVPAGPGECDPAATSLYLWSAGGLDLVNLLPGDTVGTPGAAIAAPIGAISTDGSAVYWAQGGDLYLRAGDETVQVDESLGGGGAFQTAASDGSIAFFTKAGHLYRYDADTEEAPDLTPAGGVQGVLGASASGDTVYYQDGAGLKVWRNGVTATVAPGPDAAAASSYPPATGASRVSADGLRLAFVSEAELNGQDNLDAETGEPTSQVYLYGPAPAEGALLCVSCNPSGERPEGPSTIPGALVNGSSALYKPRALSAAGTRLFFESQDELVLQDTSKVKGGPNPHSFRDVYQWEAGGVGDCTRPSGCVGLISSGRTTDDVTTFLDASADGADVFFLTSESLLGSDPGSIDVYDARVGGGFPQAPKPIPCLTDGCQSLPAPPEDPTPGTLRTNAGNGPLRIDREKPKRKSKKRRGKQRRRHTNSGRHGGGHRR